MASAPHAMSLASHAQRRQRSHSFFDPMAARLNCRGFSRAGPARISCTRGSCDRSLTPGRLHGRTSGTRRVQRRGARGAPRRASALSDRSARRSFRQRKRRVYGSRSVSSSRSTACRRELSGARRSRWQREVLNTAKQIGRGGWKPGYQSSGSQAHSPPGHLPSGTTDLFTARHFSTGCGGGPTQPDVSEKSRVLHTVLGCLHTRAELPNRAVAS